MNHTLNRRAFIKQLLAGMGVVASSGMFGSTPLARAAGNNRRLLVVNFNGGYDSLYFLQPDSGALAARRPNLYQNVNTLLDGPGNEGFNPHLTMFRDLWAAGDMAVCHRVGYVNQTKSHEDSQQAFSRGIADRKSKITSGWLNRLGALNFSSNFSLFDFTGGDLAVAGGIFRPTVVRNLSSYKFDQQSQSDVFTRDIAYAMLDSYEQKNSKARAMNEAIDLAVNAEATIKSAIASHSFPVAYPNTETGRQFRDADIAFSKLGTKVAYTEVYNMDTHGNQINVLNGKLPEFNSALSVFIANMKARGMWDDTIILIYSEFSRTIQENGSIGTDHGGGTDVYVLGPSVNGNLYSSPYDNTEFVKNWDIGVWMNMLDIYMPVVSALGYNASTVFESYTPKSLGIFS